MEAEPPHLSDESRWYTEHTALLISTLKWSLLGAATGICVGEGTRAFLCIGRAQHDFDAGIFNAEGLLDDASGRREHSLFAFAHCQWRILRHALGHSLRSREDFA